MKEMKTLTIQEETFEIVDGEARKGLEEKQPKGEYLTNHQPIKTVNGQSLVGEGNLEIESGSGVDEVAREKITELTKEIGALATKGFTAAQIDALNGMFKVAAYVKPDITDEYKAFKTAFGIADTDDGGNDDGGNDNSNEWTLLRELNNNELVFGKGITEAYPYTTDRSYRAGYYTFNDISVEHSAMYKVEYDSQDGDIECAIRIWNTATMIKAEKQESVAGTFKDMGYINSGDEIQAPEYVSSLRPAFMTLSFRTNPDGTAMVEGMVSNVKIYKRDGNGQVTS